MKYFISATVLLGLSLTLSGDVNVNDKPNFDYIPNLNQNACLEDLELKCVEEITFPAMHINVEKDVTP